MRILLAIIVFLFLIGCSNSESFTPPNTEESVPNDSVQIDPIVIEGMIHFANGKVSLGTNDKNFKENERPAMEVILDYDFYMGIHEITCGEYASIAKKAELKTLNTEEEAA